MRIEPPWAVAGLVATDEQALVIPPTPLTGVASFIGTICVARHNRQTRWNPVRPKLITEEAVVGDTNRE